MKIRTGFVSNSSSSSFLIYGAALGEEDLPKGAVDAVDEDGNPEDADEAYEAWEKIATKYKLDHHSPCYDSTHYIGLSWDRVKDNETGKEFKKRVEALLEKAFGKKIECATLEEAWSDG